MNKTILKTTHCPDYGRISRPGIQRNRPRNTIPVTLPLHRLTDFHRYTLNPMVMAVRDGVAIRTHDLVEVDGEVLKVVSVSPISTGCVEIKTVFLPRLQSK